MGEHLLATAFAVALVTICVTVHYEALVQLERLGRSLRRHRWIILVTMHGLLLAHVVEIWIFGMGYLVAEQWLALGQIVSVREDWFDYIYYSAMVYATVGFGDIVPGGPLRVVTSTEALAGLSLITWSASFTFLQMQKLFRP